MQNILLEVPVIQEVHQHIQQCLGNSLLHGVSFHSLGKEKCW